jgi:hypothetical protein
VKIPVLGWTVDERFLRHRLRSTSIGGLAGVLVAGALFLFYLYGRHVIRWDLFAVVATAAVVKLGLMAWYRLND